MSLVQLFKTYHIPCEVQMIIQQFNIAKIDYNTVVHELELQYNSGLWWLYKPQVNELWLGEDGSIEEVTKPNKVEFMTYADTQDIYERAILLEELHIELHWKYNKQDSPEDILSDEGTMETEYDTQGSQPALHTQDAYNEATQPAQ